MAQWLKQATVQVIPFGPFLDKGDGVTLETGMVSAIDHATTGIKLSKNGGALTIREQGGNFVVSSYDAYGCYLVSLSAVDTGTLGRLRVAFEEAATCLPVWQDFMVVPANVWDSMFGADKLDVAVVEQDNIDFGALQKASLNAATPNLDAAYDAAKTAAPESGGNIAAIKAKTDNLPSGVAKNVALSNFEFLMIDATDHITPKTGLTVTGTISKDGGAFASLDGSPAEVSGGIYKVDITQIEMNADIITLIFTAAGADTRIITIFTS